LTRASAIQARTLFVAHFLLLIDTSPVKKGLMSSDIKAQDSIYVNTPPFFFSDIG
jgi:hypothetical protein